MKAILTRDALRRLCDKDLANGHDRMLTTREVSVLEDDWGYSTIRRWVYDKPAVLKSIRVAQGKLKIARIRVPYSETLKVFHPDCSKRLSSTQNDSVCD